MTTVGFTDELARLHQTFSPLRAEVHGGNFRCSCLRCGKAAGWHSGGEIWQRAQAIDCRDCTFRAAMLPNETRYTPKLRTPKLAYSPWDFSEDFGTRAGWMNLEIFGVGTDPYRLRCAQMEAQAKRIESSRRLMSVQATCREARAARRIQPMVGVGPATIALLNNYGFSSAEDLATNGESLHDVPTVGPGKRALILRWLWAAKSRQEVSLQSDLNSCLDEDYRLGGYLEYLASRITVESGRVAAATAKQDLAIRKERIHGEGFRRKEGFFGISYTFCCPSCSAVKKLTPSSGSASARCDKCYRSYTVPSQYELTSLI